jgi:hypothetical protein
VPVVMQLLLRLWWLELLSCSDGEQERGVRAIKRFAIGLRAWLRSARGVRSVVLWLFNCGAVV